MLSERKNKRDSLVEFEMNERKIQEEELQALESDLVAEFGKCKADVKTEDIVATVKGLVDEENRDIVQAKQLMMELVLRQSIVDSVNKCFKSNIIEVNPFGSYFLYFLLKYIIGLESLFYKSI